MLKKVIVYTTPICPECERAKKFLRDKGIKYNEIDIFEEKEEGKKVFEKTGQKRVPIINIGNEFLIGFDKNKIEEKLKK